VQPQPQAPAPERDVSACCSILQCCAVCFRVLQPQLQAPAPERDISACCSVNVGTGVGVGVGVGVELVWVWDCVWVWCGLGVGVGVGMKYLCVSLYVWVLLSVCTMDVRMHICSYECMLDA